VGDNGQMTLRAAFWVLGGLLGGLASGLVLTLSDLYEASRRRQTAT
jgi:hypothetical protein